MKQTCRGEHWYTRGPDGESRCLFCGEADPAPPDPGARAWAVVLGGLGLTAFWAGLIWWMLS